jgi:hypothetical protein
MIARDVDLVMEQPGARRRSTDFRRGKRLGERDHLIHIDKPVTKPNWMSDEAYQKAPESIRIRECHTGGRLLVSTLCDRSDTA